MPISRDVGIPSHHEELPLTIAAFNSACDLFLAVFPIYIFWRFNWNVKVKLVLVSLLSLGVV